jgi:hypothetical protein
VLLRCAGASEHADMQQTRRVQISCVLIVWGETVLGWQEVRLSFCVCGLLWVSVASSAHTLALADRPGDAKSGVIACSTYYPQDSLKPPTEGGRPRPTPTPCRPPCPQRDGAPHLPPRCPRTHKQTADASARSRNTQGEPEEESVGRWRRLRAPQRTPSGVGGP